MSDHALLAPSDAGNWVICTAKPAMCQKYPETEPSLASREGTAAHWVASQVFQGLQVTAAQDPEGTEITDEMLDAVEVYKCDVRLVERNTMSPNFAFEKTIQIPRIHRDHNWGTPDARHYNPETKTLTVWDFKYGHKMVEVFENYQLIDYTAGLLDEFPETETVRLRIVQPRNYHRDGPVREWVVKPKDLEVYLEVLRRAAAKALDPEKRRCFPNPGCRHCSASHACDALRGAVLSAVDGSGRPMTTDLPDDALGFELRLMDATIERLEARRLGLAEQATSRVRAGHSVPGYMLQASESRARWLRPVEEVIALGDMMGVTLAKPGVLTPAQAIKAGVPAELIGTYSGRSMGEAKLVPADVKAARKVFGS